MKANLTGGPSIIFTRYHERNKTKIRKNEIGEHAKFCKSIAGYDANSLYLSCFGKKFPCGDFKVRFAPDFKIEKRPRLCYSKGAIEWMEYEMTKNNVKIHRNLHNFL